MQKISGLLRFLLSVLFLLTLYNCVPKPDTSSREENHSGPLQIPHLEKQGSSTHLVVDGKPFLLIAGELHNSTAGGLETMRPVWEKLAGKNLNTVIATVSWELIEPQEGNFDFTLVDSMIAGARKADLKLVLIWFGSWKNASSVYVPSWVKRDFEKYPRVKDEQGKPLEILSTFGSLSMKKDAQAFAMLMRHIRETDSKQQTVIMMQVENEVGVLDHLGETPGNARRDFSEMANAAWNGAVPDELMAYLEKNKTSLFPELKKVWEESGSKTTGTWEEVFGKGRLKPGIDDWKFYSYYTEELFMAWNYAKYIEEVTAAGKKEYPIPMYVNAWLKQPFSYWPGRYPSGGPLPQVHDVWRAAAPSIDFFAPDIYTDEFLWVCSEFTRNGNPLFIPEIQGGNHAGPRALYVYGEYGAGMYSPFAIDNPRYAEGDPLDEYYRVLNMISPVILENQGTGKMKGILVDKNNPVQRFELGDYIIEARLSGGENTEVAGGLIIQSGKEEFICAGRAIQVSFSLKTGSMRLAVDAADEVKFEDGNWVSIRRLNGDEVQASTWSGTGLIFHDDKVGVQKISLYAYK